MPDFCVAHLDNVIVSDYDRYSVSNSTKLTYMGKVNIHNTHSLKCVISLKHFEILVYDFSLSCFLSSTLPLSDDAATCTYLVLSFSR